MKSYRLTSNLVKKVMARLKITGNFTSVFVNGNTSSDAAALRLTLENLLSARLGYSVRVVALYEGSLVADYVVPVPATNTVLANAVVAAISDMGSNATEVHSMITTVETACRASGGCDGGITLSNSEVTEISVESLQSGGGSTMPKCGAGCVAAAVVLPCALIAGLIFFAFVKLRRAPTTEEPQDSPTQPPNNPLATRRPSASHKSEDMEVEEVV
jgi:hypothetical protein